MSLILREFSTGWLAFLKTLLLGPSVQATTFNIDWAVADSFYYIVSGSSLVNFAFQNAPDGKFIMITVTNPTGTDVEVAFPNGLSYSNENVDLGVLAGKENVYTVLYANGKYLVSSTSKMVVL